MNYVKIPANVAKVLNLTGSYGTFTDEIILQFLEYAADTFEFDEEGCEFEVTNNLKKAFIKFEKDLEKVLEDYIKKNPLVEGYTVDDLLEEDCPYLVFMTLRGEGVGIWDGSWDDFFKNPKEDIKKLEKVLKQKLNKYADDSGSGALNELLMDTVYEQCY